MQRLEEMDLDTRLPAPEAYPHMGIKASTAAVWRGQGKGPPYCRTGKLHGRVYYRVGDLLEWLRSGTFKSTSQESAG